MPPGSVRDGPRPAAPAPARDQNNVPPLDDAQHGQQAAPTGNQDGNVSSFEEGDDNVAEKGAAGGLGKRDKAKRHCWRFKWWYVAGVVIFLAILLPIM